MTEELKFEKEIELLEKIVADLETGDVTLEDALKKYEEGVSLSRACQKRLAQAEKKIEVLTRSLDGHLEKEPFQFEEESAPKPSKRSAAAKKKVQEEEDATDNLEEDRLI